jgi:hypothetical protein
LQIPRFDRTSKIMIRAVLSDNASDLHFERVAASQGAS